MSETEINHRAKKPYYSSWAEFLKDKDNVLNCNCTYGAPLIHWNWISDYKYENCELNERDTENDNLVILIYPSWGSKVSSIQVLVRRSDEPQIAEFIRVQSWKGIKDE